MPPPHVRPGRPADAAELAALQVRAQRAFAAPLLPAGALAGLTEEAVKPSWDHVLAGAGRAIVAVDAAGLPVGVAVTGPPDDADRVAGRDVELGLLLVDPDHLNAGHGSRLLAAVAELAREDGAQLLVAWVLEGDRILRTFLEGAGWRADGSRRELDTGAGTAVEVRLRAEL